MVEKLKQKSDVVVALVFIIFALIVTVLTLQIQTTQSRIMPFFSIALVVGGSLVLLFQSITRDETSDNKLLYKKRELIVWLMLVGFFILITRLGFYTSVFIFVSICFFYLRGGFTTQGFTRKLIFQSLVLAIVFVVLTYVCFTIGFRLVLPSGILI